MNDMNSLLTEEEQKIITKLESEMLFALTVAHMTFYKNEIQAIISQAKRRNSFLEKLEKEALV
ncbi:hypothetical protein [Metabacillus litoralis]|uniref:hypothetical protein n=1 Tax=Metabacillus TaxID=2675233 RepID=UPI000EF59BBD|nr:hypothetical protein [Metabacillus litoralis]MCM3160226.1 hypothetical protein [Metabacillus litoralis]MCM3408811.1 hypothetical protein [Metabacillus litoralis]